MSRVVTLTGTGALGVAGRYDGGLYLLKPRS